MTKPITHAAALELGYTVDTRAAGRPIAYKGRRDWPTAVVPVFTELEVELLGALTLARTMCDEALPEFNWRDSCLDANAIDLLNRGPVAINAALDQAGIKP